MMTTRRMLNTAPWNMPSQVGPGTVNPAMTTASPGVKQAWAAKVMIRINRKAFRLFSSRWGGTSETRTRTATVASMKKKSGRVFTQTRIAISARAPHSLVRGSSRCMEDSPG